MNTLPSELAERVRLATTTLARCWVVHRKDGIKLGFTDHDEILVIAGTECEPQTAMQSTEAVSQLGFAPDNSEVAGALIDARISAADINDGRYDDARVETWLVDWNIPNAAILLHSHFLGEIIQEDGIFRAELRGRTAQLDKLTGRAYERHCDADLGDERCGFDVSQAAYSAVGTVSAVSDANSFDSASLSDYEPGWFAGGAVLWTAGANAGTRQSISLSASANPQRVTLWTAPNHPISEGDAFELTAGCDKRFSTCRKKFANATNFRGFPHIPGDDFAFSYARNGVVHDGSPLVEDEL